MGCPSHAPIPAWQREEVDIFCRCQSNVCVDFTCIFFVIKNVHEEFLAHYKKTGVVFLGKAAATGTQDYAHVTDLFGDTDREYYNPSEAALETGVLNCSTQNQAVF